MTEPFIEYRNSAFSIFFLFWLSIFGAVWPYFFGFEQLFPDKILMQFSICIFFAMLCALGWFITIRRITFDGQELKIRYGFWYSRKLHISEIKNITYEPRPVYHGAILLVYPKNQPPFSRALTAAGAENFAKQLSAYFNPPRP